jgi:hypothetical protein
VVVLPVTDHTAVSSTVHLPVIYLQVKRLMANATKTVNIQAVVSPPIGTSPDASI